MAPASFAGSFKISGKKVFIRLKNQVCDSSEELLHSDLCFEIIRHAVAALERRRSFLLKVFGSKEVNDAKKLTGKVPTEKQVSAWIESAKQLPRVVTY